MNNQKELEGVWEATKSLEGTVIYGNNIAENLQFIHKSKELAKKHEWLYHCTTVSALKSILKNREFWLSNLKCVNDMEETERIDVPEYENKYYVCCFTYDAQIPDIHWKEYGSEYDGVLIGIKTNWFLRKAMFMCSDNSKCNDEFMTIMKNDNEALRMKITEQKKGRIINPFYINSFDFYQIKYDDELFKNISGIGYLGENGIQVRTLTPEIGGIIKATHGMCRRFGEESYDKDWTTEKEVRLKVGIQQLEIFANGYKIHDGQILKTVFFPKIAIPVSENAFDVVKIGFSPQFYARKEFLEEIRQLLPESIINVI